MALPTDLVLVRHGESEGNVAHRQVRQGRLGTFSQSFLNRSSATWRLTDRGRRQSDIAGGWIRRHIGRYFYRYYTSPYFRAMETAALLRLPLADWLPDFCLRERDWDDLDGIPGEEGVARRTQYFNTGQGDSFVESLSSLYLRVDAWLERIYRECGGQQVIAVCHHEVMWAFRMRLEGISRERFLELDAVHHPHTRIHNTQVMRYSRRDPASGHLADEFGWLYSVLPEDPKRSPNRWQEIVMPTQSNVDLLATVSQQPPELK